MLETLMPFLQVGCLLFAVFSFVGAYVRASAPKNETGGDGAFIGVVFGCLAFAVFALSILYPLTSK